MSSDDSSDDEMMQKLREATDNNLFNDTMFNKDTETIPIINKDLVKQKSQRYLDTHNKDNELNISEGMKSFVSKKLTKLIEEQICFVDVKKPKTNNHTEIDNEIGVKLFSDSENYLKINNEDENFKEILEKQLECRKLLKRRSDKIEDMTESEKCKAASIDIGYLMSGEETKAWKKEHRKKEYKYKSIKNRLQFIEPDNEFTKCRKKNNWDESKISRKDFS